MNYFAQTIKSPLGDLIAVATLNGLTHVLWQHDRRYDRLKHQMIFQETEILRETADQLDEYFRGQRSDFELPLAPMGTSFQTQVWRALREIPYGETRSYGELARQLGMPGAARGARERRPGP